MMPPSSRLGFVPPLLLRRPSSRRSKEVAFSPYFRGRRYQSGRIGLTDVLFINASRPGGTHQAAAAIGSAAAAAPIARPYGEV